MSDLNNNKNTFNFPAYLHIPFFLYQDNRLEKSAMLMAAFFYSLHTAGLEIKASKEYLCDLLVIRKSQYFNLLNLLESCGYIKRSGFTNRKKMQWVYCPKSSITVDETDSGPAHRTPVQPLNTSPVGRTKLVQSSGLNYSSPLDTYNKDDTKVYKNTSTSLDPSFSYFFTELLDRKLLAQKLETDRRSEEEFLTQCKVHVDTKSDNSLPTAQRANALVKLLAKLKKENKIFRVSGSKAPDEPNQDYKQRDPDRDPTAQEFNDWKNCMPGLDWVGRWHSRKQSA